MERERGRLGPGPRPPDDGAKCAAQCALSEPDDAPFGSCGNRLPLQYGEQFLRRPHPDLALWFAQAARLLRAATLRPPLQTGSSARGTAGERAGPFRLRLGE